MCDFCDCMQADMYILALFAAAAPQITLVHKSFIIEISPHLGGIQVPVSSDWTNSGCWYATQLAAQTHT